MKYPLNYARDVWEHTVPGTEVPRLEVAQSMVEMWYSEDRKEKDSLLRHLAMCNVLSVGQLAKLRQLTRQRVYVKLLQWGVDIPSESVRGSFDCTRVNDFVRAITLMVEDPANYQSKAEKFIAGIGTPAVVEHLTGLRP